MAKVNFYLRDGKATKETPIILFISHNRQRTKIPTGKTVHPKYWNSLDQSVRTSKEFPQGKLINEFLRQAQEIVESTIFQLELELQRPPEKEELTAAIQHQLNPSLGAITKAKKLGFFEVFDLLIAESLNGDRLDDFGKRFSYRTVQKYRTCLNLFKDFHKIYHFTFETIDQEFYKRILAYLNSKNYRPNTVGKYIQTLKAFLLFATEKGYNQNEYFRSKKFKAFKEPGFSIYLTEEELVSILDLDLTNHSHLDRVRDLFLVGCWTGLRFSDFTSIKPQNIDGDFLHMAQFKGSQKVVVPILPVFRQILNKYEGKFKNPLPTTISNQKMNAYLKEIAKMSPKLQHLIQDEITMGGVKKKIELQKWEMVTTHTARRSFATNMYKSGYPSISLMKITGHRTEKAFLLYIKVTPEDSAQRLMEHWTKLEANNGTKRI